VVTSLAKKTIFLDHIVSKNRPGAIVHTAAQPSHDLAASRPFDDFDVNAVGTLNLLEAARRTCPEGPFVHMSTNKVYGDAPNRLNLIEKETRWDYADPEYANGIKESFSIDHSIHSLFGASKVAADVLVQEYGRYFQMASARLFPMRPHPMIAKPNFRWYFIPIFQKFRRAESRENFSCGPILCGRGTVAIVDFSIVWLLSHLLLPLIAVSVEYFIGVTAASSVTQGTMIAL
jgi:nucleoside-diphosphate-sugar epimerase